MEHMYAKVSFLQYSDVDQRIVVIKHIRQDQLVISKIYI